MCLSHSCNEHHSVRITNLTYRGLQKQETSQSLAQTLGQLDRVRCAIIDQFVTSGQDRNPWLPTHLHHTHTNCG